MSYYFIHLFFALIYYFIVAMQETATQVPHGGNNLLCV